MVDAEYDIAQRRAQTSAQAAEQTGPLLVVGDDFYPVRRHRVNRRAPPKVSSTPPAPPRQARPQHPRAVPRPHLRPLAEGLS